MKRIPADFDREYSVSVGFARVKVMATSTFEAIETARQRLSNDMPRLWDVIQSMETRRFHVTMDNDN